MKRINHRIIHIHIQHHRTVAHLRTRYGQRLVILLLTDKSQELPASRHIASLAHVDKRPLLCEGIQSCQPLHTLFRRLSHRRHASRCL